MFGLALGLGLVLGLELAIQLGLRLRSCFMNTGYCLLFRVTCYWLPVRVKISVRVILGVRVFVRFRYVL